MQKWMVLAKKADFYGIGRKFGVDPVIARVIRNRERISEEEIEQYLHGGMNQIYSFQLMKGMEKALELLLEKIGEKKKIRIIGDYDIDGVCSTYILLIGLKKAGAIVDIDIPYPRDQETKMSPRFMELKNHIWSQVYQEYLEVRK